MPSAEILPIAFLHSHSQLLRRLRLLALLLLAPSFLRSLLRLFRTFGPGLRLIGRRAICRRAIVWRGRVPTIVRRRGSGTIIPRWRLWWTIRLGRSRFGTITRRRLSRSILRLRCWWTIIPRWRLWWAIRLGGSRFRTVARRRLSRPILRLRCWWTIIPRWRLWWTIRLGGSRFRTVARGRLSRAILGLRSSGPVSSRWPFWRTVGLR